MILYERLWKTMKEKNINQYRLMKEYMVSSGQINRLKHNANVSSHTLDMLCTILDCKLEDIAEFQYDSSQEAEFGIRPESENQSPKKDEQATDLKDDAADKAES